ncbi:hypothetical protein BACFIN_09222 [Bacteroides finegoldii DSM 17565]|nr:hypothetical protein BACFIN_09222 [Bacteroides finegoldii DSM 17565]
MYFPFSFAAFMALFSSFQQEKYMIEDNYRLHLIKIKNRKEDSGVYSSIG